MPIEIINRKIVTEKIEYPFSNYKESEDFKFKHLTCKDIVKQILKQDKLARKDYTWLLLLTWIKQGAVKLIIPLEDYGKMYKPESVSRVARELFTEARNGDIELQFLLKDTETIEKRDNLFNLNHDYYQDIKLSNQAMMLK